MIKRFYPAVFLALLCFALIPATVMAKQSSLLDLTDMCDRAYGPKDDLPIEKDGYEVFMRGSDKDSGFQGLAYQRDSDGAVFVVFAGTQMKDPKDVLADFGIVGTVYQQAERATLATLKGTFSKVFNGKDTTPKEMKDAQKKPLKPNNALKKQLEIAQKFFEKAKEEGKEDNEKNLIYVTGHSLGGYLAQVIAADNEVAGITFNAPGAYGMSKKKGKEVVNHTRKSDLVGTFGQHIGPLKEHPDTAFTFESLNSAYAGKNHSISQFHIFFDDPKKDQHSDIKDAAIDTGKKIVDGAEKGAVAVGDATEKAGEALVGGAQTAGKAIKKGAVATGKAVKSGAKKAGKAAKKAGKKIIDFFSGKK